MFLVITRRSERKKIFIQIREVTVPGSDQEPGYKHHLTLGKEIPDEAWLRTLGEHFAKLDPAWESKEIIVEIRIPVLSAAR